MFYDKIHFEGKTKLEKITIHVRFKAGFLSAIPFQGAAVKLAFLRSLP
ncbi:hypothetical protein [Gimesia chilikensis]|nr:hypothetical protein [Gimesia chilikensis]